MTEHKPWWQDDPELLAIRQQVMREIDEAHDRPALPSDAADPVLTELLSGDCRRELASARDDLNRARARYDDAVRTARTAGFSWGEIGQILGVARQQLHRRFSRPRSIP